MRDVKFTDEQMKTLLSDNEFLRRPEANKYEYFAKKDPFPYIPDALLNSIDILKYVLTTGMLDPFIPKDLHGATYTCNFSGASRYWDDNGVQQDGTEELELRPNSIAFLEVETMFRIPEYLILRFNLMVQHVHKGLLLGTGPIVDPEFQGKLYIPLHNLTSNTYIIKKGTPLIGVEFTKLSKYKQRYFSKKSQIGKVVSTLNFSSISHVTRKFEPRALNEYISRALIGDERFRKKKAALRSKSDELSIGSSIPKVIKEAQNAACLAEKNAKNAEESARKMEKQNKRVTIWTIAGLVIAFIAVGLSVLEIINDVSKRVDDISAEYRKLLVEYSIIREDYKKAQNEKENLNDDYRSIKDEHEDMKKTLSEFHDLINDIQRNARHVKSLDCSNLSGEVP